MSDPKLIVRAGAPGIVKTAIGERPATPIPTQGILIKPGAIVAKGSPPRRVDEPLNASSAFSRRGGRRHRSGRKTRRRHRGGGLLSVVQDGPVWRIKEDVGGSGGEQVKDSAVSEESWPTAKGAMDMATLLKGIKRSAPTQEGRYDIVDAGKTLVTMKKSGGRRRRYA